MSIMYNAARRRFANGELKWDSALKVLLLHPTYAPVATHEFVSSVAAHECSGPGCVGGFGASGRKLITASVVQDDALNRAVLSFGALVWRGINAGIVGKLVVVRERSSDATSWLVALLDGPGFPVTTSGGVLTVDPTTTAALVLE